MLTQTADRRGPFRDFCHRQTTAATHMRVTRDSTRSSDVVSGPLSPPPLHPATNPPHPHSCKREEGKAGTYDFLVSCRCSFGREALPSKVTARLREREGGVVAGLGAGGEVEYRHKDRNRKKQRSDAGVYGHFAHPRPVYLVHLTTLTMRTTAAATAVQNACSAAALPGRPLPESTLANTNSCKCAFVVPPRAVL